MKSITAPFGGLIGAILGGILWAKYIQWTGYTAGFAAIGIGFFTGIGILLTGNRTLNIDSKQQWFMLSVGAVVFSIVGIFIGKYLDVRWNAITGITEQILANEPMISEEAAISIAETQYSGTSKWELMKKRMEPFDIIYGLIAVLVAFYITYNPWIRQTISKISKTTQGRS